MPLKDRFRRAITLPSRSTSSSLSHTPTIPSTPTNENSPSTPTPSITLTKTSSRLGLSKTLTWGTGRHSKDKREEKERKRLEDWEKSDAAAWNGPKKPKSKQHQDLLRAFEWKFSHNAGGEEVGEGGRRWSGWSGVSGVSPGTSRMNSVDGERPRRFGSFGMGRKRSSGAGTGGLSREVSRDEGGVGTVAEE